jgi:hypothetical protein
MRKQTASVAIFMIMAMATVGQAGDATLIDCRE